MSPNNLKILRRDSEKYNILKVGSTFVNKNWLYMVLGLVGLALVVKK